MPVDVVGDESQVSVHDLSLEKREPSRNFSLDDISQEKYAELRNVVADSQFREENSLIVATFLVLSNKIRQENVPDFASFIESQLEDYIQSEPENFANSAFLLTQTQVLYPDKLPQFLDKDDYYRNY